MFPFEFTRPSMLILIIPIAIGLALAFVRSLSDFPRPQRIASLVTRSIVVLLMIFSLADLTWLLRTQEQFVLFLVDRSVSIGDAAQTTASDYLKLAREKQGRNRTAYLPFSLSAGKFQHDPASMDLFREDPNAAAARLSPARTGQPGSTAPAPELGTDIGAAIEAAAGYIPPGFVPHIVILTDGNQTQGNAIAAAVKSRVPVSTVPLPNRTEPEVQVSSVRVPTEVREGEPFFVDVTITSNHDDEGLVEIFQGDHKVLSEIRTLKTGENSFRLQQSVERDRTAAFKVRVSGLTKDTLLDNNSDAGLVYTAGKPRILIVESEPNLIRELAYALEDEGILVDIRPPQGMPDSLAGLQNYELVILSNVPATELTQQQMEVTRSWVQELGGGFIMLGGEQSFGLGGYYKSTLEEILPVRSDFEKEKEKPSLGMVLIIDRSGSMDGDKLEMAKTAARAAVDLLGNRDQVAVLAFEDQTTVISEMQSAAAKGKISDEVSRIVSGGGTNMYPAMQLSFDILNSTAAKLKHVIMLTDGISNSGDFQGLAQQMASAKISVSTVSIGGEGAADPALLESIARIGKGRYYLAEDPAQVPRIFARETMTASKSAIDEQPFIPQVIRATRAMASLDLESAPFLLGYVMTRPKPTSEVILATEKGDPLLAWWRYGLGMTAAFTSDAKSRWAAEWLTWPGYGKFWTQLVRQIMRRSDTRGLEISFRPNGQITALTVDATDDSGQFLDDASLEVTLISPLLIRDKQVLRQTAPGRYTGDLKTPEPGAYHLEISASQNGQILSRQSRGLMIGYHDELRIRPTNDAMLKELAAVSGGQFDPAPEQLFNRTDKSALRPTPLWPWLLTLAAFFLIMDVALRRIDLLPWLPVRWKKN